MSPSDPREKDQRRRQELLGEIDRLEELAEEDELAADRLTGLREELERIERRLDPDAFERKRRAGRSDAD